MYICAPRIDPYIPFYPNNEGARVHDVYTGRQGYPFCANTLLLLLFTKMSVTLERSVAVLHKKARAAGRGEEGEKKKPYTIWI